MADAQDQTLAGTQKTTPPVRAAAAQYAPADGGDPRARAAALRAEAAAIEASLKSAETVNVRVGPPHSQMWFAGYILTADYPTPVPSSRLADLQQAAGIAGVNLITEG